MKNMMPIEKVLSNLAQVKQCKAGQWSACCPAHEDRSPSLQVTETRSGVVLLKCWAGCASAEIVAAVGLSMRDLFPQSGINRSVRVGPSRAAIEFERLILEIGNAHLKSGIRLNKGDQERFELAGRRVRTLT